MDSTLSPVNLSTKIKVLFLSHSASLAGAEKNLLKLLEGLDRIRFEPLVLIPSKGLLYNEIDKRGIRVVEYPIMRWVAFHTEFGFRHFKKCFGQLLTRVRFISQLIKNERADVVYTNTITCIDGALAAKICRIPHVWHIHEILQKNTSLKSYLPFFLVRFLVINLSSEIIFVSKAAQNKLMLKKRYIDQNRTSVVYNGWDIDSFLTPDQFIDNDRYLLQPLGVEKGTKVVACIGTLIEIKGQADFIEAAGIVISKFKNVVFLVIGSGNNAYLDKLKCLSRKLGLENKVFFLGFQKDIAPYYRCIDLLVSSSIVESLGGTLIEAMVASKPVVATRIDGNKEIVVDGETGFLVAPKSPIDMALAIIKLLSDSNLAEKMGKLGNLRASRLFNQKNYITSVEDVIAGASKDRNV